MHQSILKKFMREELFVMDTPLFHSPKSPFIRQLLSRKSAKLFVSLSILSIGLILVTPLHAGEGYYLLAGMGESKAKVKSKYLLSGSDDSYENLDFQLSLGYQFNNNVLIEFSSISHDSFLDVVFSDSAASVYENIALVGYRYDISEKFSVTPRLGYSSWKIESSDGLLFNSGSGATTSRKGSDITFMLSASYSLFYMTLQSGAYEFGSLNSILIGMEFKL